MFDMRRVQRIWVACWRDCSDMHEDYSAAPYGIDYLTSLFGGI